MYSRKEIKLNIDMAIEKEMWEMRNAPSKEEKWDLLVEIQNKLYEEFGIFT